MSSLEPPRVVITGIGMVTPLGADRETSWQALCAGQAAGRWLPQFPETLASQFPNISTPETPTLQVSTPQVSASECSGRSSEVAADSGSLLARPRRTAPKPAGTTAGTIAAEPCWAGMPAPLNRLPVEFRKNDPVIACALTAAAEAIADARLELASLPRDRIGCVLGTSKGGLRSFAKGLRRLGEPAASTETAPVGFDNSPEFDEGTEWDEGRLWSQFLPHGAAGAIAAHFDLRGAALCPVAACATGLVSIARGMDLIRHGCCDVVLAGSSDASLQEVLLASFRRLGVLARGFTNPAEACRPFDRERTGFLMGEGAAVLVLESERHALQRGARPYAECLAAGQFADVSHLTRMQAGSGSLSHLLRELLREAHCLPQEIDYINLHGTGTRQNDVAETRALKEVFGQQARHIPCSSLKGALGHLLGAAGSVELAMTLLAMRDSVIPPTLNLRHPDPACDLDYTPGQSRHRPVTTALKLSLGFGGHLAGILVRRS